MKHKLPIVPPTDAQLCYIEILAQDLLLNHHRRNSHISSIVGRPIAFLDELSLGEASLVINKFKEWKDQSAFHQ